MPTALDKKKIREDAKGFIKKLGTKLDVKVGDTEITISKGGDKTGRFMVMNLTEDQAVEVVYQALYQRAEEHELWESKQWRGG